MDSAITLMCVLFATALLIAFAFKCTEAIVRAREDSEWRSDGRRDYQEDPEDEGLLSQDSYWVCADCGAEFRLPSGETPTICPSCGEKFVEMPAGIETNAGPYICDHCGPYVLLDGDESEACPTCGSRDVNEGTWLLKRPARWVCAACSQEFTTITPPIQCPHCGEKFKGVEGEVDEDSTVLICPSCGEKTEMFNGEEVEFCPKCGREMSE